MFSVSIRCLKAVVGNANVVDKPSVRIARVATDVLEDGLGSLSLTCIADSNPPAKVFWSKEGDESEPHDKSLLQFNPVYKQDAGTYLCWAENSVGRSGEERSSIDVLCKWVMPMI